MAITIPEKPLAITNPENLYNDVYGDIPPLAWSNPDFHSRLGWIKGEVNCTITAWYSSVNQSPGASPLRVSTMFRAEVRSGVGMDFDVRSVMELPHLVVYSLKAVANPSAMPLQVTPYPGFEALHPVTDNPIGAAWPEHPWAGRKMFHANPETTYKLDAIFETPAARFQKRVFVVKPGPGPFGTGGVNGEAWEQVYTR